MVSEGTPEERADRLSKMRENLKRMVSEESPEEHADRLSKMRKT